MLLVIDASIGIKWFIREDHSDTALIILENLLTDPNRFGVPELFFFELAHTFNRLIPRPTQIQLSLLNRIVNSPMRRFSMTAELVSGIAHFQAKGLSGYDSAYLALAKSVKGRWITADVKAHRKVGDSELCRLISDF